MRARICFPLAQCSTRWRPAQLPFRGESSGLIFDAILDRAPVAPVRLNPESRRSWNAFINKALEKDRNLRYQSASEMRADLLRLKRDSDSGRAGATGTDSQPGVVTPALGVRSVSSPVAPSGSRVASSYSTTRALWKVLVPLGAALLAAASVVFWLGRSLAPPRVLRTTQITRDGTPKDAVLTDGSRVFISELIGPNHVLVQGSASGGETSLLAKPFDSFRLSDISRDNSELLLIDTSGDAGLIASAQQLWTLPLPSGSPRRLGRFVAQDATWSPDGKQIAFAKGSNIFLADADGNESPPIHISRRKSIRDAVLSGRHTHQILGL